MLRFNAGTFSLILVEFFYFKIAKQILKRHVHLKEEFMHITVTLSEVISKWNSLCSRESRNYFLCRLLWKIWKESKSFAPARVVFYLAVDSAKITFIIQPHALNW